MKHILVCVKAVPVSSSVEVDGQHRLKRDGASLQWNIADESALEAAFRLADQGWQCHSPDNGPSKTGGPIAGIAGKGGQSGGTHYRPSHGRGGHPGDCRALASAAEKLGPFDAVFCGCKAIDGETGQVPGELAAALGLPCISNAEKVEAAGDELLVTRRLEDGVQNLTVSGPAVISFSSYSYPLRLAGILGMRRARKTPVEILTAADLGLTPEDCGLKGSLTKVVAMESRFPGLRRGPKETDLDAGVQNLRVLLREVRP